MRCLYAKRDHLHEFAERIIARLTEIIGARAISSRDFGGVRATILHREGAYQVEFLDMDPNTRVPTHTHPGADGIEYVWSGEALIRVRAEALAEKYSPVRRALFLRGKSIRVDGETPHSLEVGPFGFQFLSIQHWGSVIPKHIGEHWRGAPSSPIHEQILRGLA
jgi:hypothetical protein